MMSIHQTTKVFHNNTNEFIQKKKNFSEFNFNLSELIIPFSKMFKSHKPIDIYSGGERIPFKERDPEFKMILKQEFSIQNSYP